MDKTFADRLRQLCNIYYNDYMDMPPCPVSSYERMNSLLKGTRKPTMDELIKISEAYDVSINYLLTGDEMFPGLRRLGKKEAEKILQAIEELRTDSYGL
ncbi:MAG TPA: hypothetical protein DCZ91_08830 [Lachnospiraceae bacterium]|nr:hypothetical protein [Lachnospiraceae bacterium]